MLRALFFLVFFLVFLVSEKKQKLIKF